MSNSQKQGFTSITCPKGITNGNVLKLARDESCVLLTLDKDFSNADLYHPMFYSGIVVYRIHPPKLDMLIQATKRLLKLFTNENPNGKLYIVDNEGVEIFNENS